MSSVFVAVSSCSPEPSEDMGDDDLVQYLPFEPEEELQWSSPKGTVRLKCWSVVGEAARGSFWYTGDRSALVYDEWIQEPPQVDLDTDVATGIFECLENRDLDSMARHRAGEWSVVRIRDGMTIEGATDFLGARHLYYGQHRGRAVVSNRALLAATVLHGGTLPEMNPHQFAWLLAVVAAPFGSDTPWPTVNRLRLDETIRVRQGQVELHRRKWRPSRGRVDWEQWHQEFVRRCGQVNRFPELSFRLGLTGGKDSRLVLAGLEAAGAIDKVKTAYLCSWPDRADAIVGRNLARQRGLDFELVEPQINGDIFAQLDRHNFQTEYGVNAWDLKGTSRRSRFGSIHGNLGEIYRGHAKLKFALSWKVVRRHYGSDQFVDPLRVLQPMAREYCRRKMLDWVDEMRADDHPRLQVHDAYHRLGRMQGWVGQIQLCDGCGLLALNPIPSPGLLRAYQGLSLRNRQAERVHFELMRRCDDQLWKKGFAQDRWSPLIFRSLFRGDPPEAANGDRPSTQMERWRQKADQIRDYLRNPRGPMFFELVDRSAVNRLLDRAGPSPDVVTLRTIWGLVGIRRSLEEPFSSHPMKVEKA